MFYLLTLSIILRLVLINQSLWLDESIQALALMGRQGPLLQYALADYQPPLYHFVGYAFTHLLGYSELVLRLPSILSGVLTVYFVAKIGELIGSRKVGLVAGLLAATNPLLIYYSQEGRTYALTTFLVTASMYYFIRLLKEKNPKYSILYTLYTILFLWTSYLSWFVLFSQGLYAIYRKRYDLLALQSASALTLLLWLPSLVASLGIGQSTMSTSPEWGRVVGGLTWKSLPLTWVKFNLGRISFDHKWLYALLVGLIGILHLHILRRVVYQKHSVLLVWVIPPIILGLISALFLPVYSYFRVLFVLPAYLLLLAVGLSRFKSSVFTILSVGFQLLALSYFWFSPRYHREDWRTLVSDLPSDAVIAMPSRAQSAPLLYYSITQPIIEPSHEVLLGDKIYYIRYAEDLFDSSRLGHTNFITSGYTIKRETSYSGIQVDLYEK